MSESFDVWQYFENDWHDKVGADLSAEEAVKLAARYTTRPAALLGITRKVTIVERESDDTVFEWQFGVGVTFPREEEAGGGLQ